MTTSRYAADVHKASLIADYGTPDQRALAVIPDADRDDMRQRAVSRARQHGVTAPLTWLDHADLSTSPVTLIGV